MALTGGLYQCAYDRKQPPRGRVLEFPPEFLYLRTKACRSSGGEHFTAGCPLVPHSCVLRAGAAPRNCVPPPGATPAPPPVPLRPRISLEQLDLVLQRRSRAEVLMHSLPLAPQPLQPRAHRGRIPARSRRAAVPARLRVCEVALDRSSSFTCRVGRVWRTRPTSLRRRPRGGAAARPPCAASRGRKLHCNQSVRGSSWRTTHR